MNILILDRGSRGGACGFPHHYCNLGHKVFMIKPGETGFHWENIPTWPRMLMKNSQKKRNFEVAELPIYEDFKYGEDRFLSVQNEELRQKMYESNVYCELITIEDLSSGKIKIDAVHTTDHCVGILQDLLDFMKKHIPHTKWISSTFDPGSFRDGMPCGIIPPNVVRILPAIYENEFKQVNSCDFYRHPFEFELLGVDTENQQQTSGFGSFNHNFSNRDPNYWNLFSELSEFVMKNHNIHLENYGGNIRGQGADLKYDGPAGITGNLKTLSPRSAAEKFMNLRAVLHIKNLDWGGGVPAYARFSGTPMIVLKGYLQGSKMDKIWEHGLNCLEVSSAQEMYEAILFLNENEEAAKKLGANAKLQNQELFNQTYWDNWDNMLRNLN